MAPEQRDIVLVPVPFTERIIFRRYGRLGEECFARELAALDELLGRGESSVAPPAGGQDPA